jgi:hypothetical protein
VNRRALGLIGLAGVAVAFLAYMVTNVPIVGPKLSREEATRYWGAAAIGALIVVAGASLVMREVVRARRRSPSKAAGESSRSASAAADRPLVPRSLRFEGVPRWAVVTAATVSAGGVAVAFITAAPLWNGGLAFLLPWIPLVAIEARWKYATYGVFAAFALLVLLQVLHMGEHAMQVGQLAVSNGDLASSHGVFGQLDFELVHFATDTTLWIVLGLLLIVFRGNNRWLWVAFAAASLHQVEHFYLFWLYHAHRDVYMGGGFAGIMGENGMIGSPLDRPYLHFTYNLIIVVPMVIALWDQARRVDDEKRPPAPA